MFPCEQCAEKYFKAFLNEHDREAPKIHNLLDLLKLGKEIDASLEISQPDLRILERFSVGVRYPGLNADKDDAKSAYQAVKTVRVAVRQKLGLSDK